MNISFIFNICEQKREELFSVLLGAPTKSWADVVRFWQAILPLAPDMFGVVLMAPSATLSANSTEKDFLTIKVCAFMTLNLPDDIHWKRLAIIRVMSCGCSILSSFFLGTL
jgi:hypothetical protein